MPPKKYVWLDKIKSVDREYVAVEFGARRLLVQAQANPLLLRSGPALGDIRDAARHVEGTYLIRLFAEFETGLRLYRSAVRGQPARSTVEQLIDHVAARRMIPYVRLNHVHEVRIQRNNLVHDRETAISALPLAVARGRLCHFFNFLPEHW
jgi:hypothetical protein